jgi:type IV secretion system protein VirB1
MKQALSPTTDPLVSRNLDDATTPGVMVELDPEAADLAGAFEETALSEADAWDANADIEEEPHHGKQ